MATIELRESDKRRAINLNRKNKYGLDSKQMISLINTPSKRRCVQACFSRVSFD